MLLRLSIRWVHGDGPTENMWLFALSQADLFILLSLIVRQGRGEYSYTSHQAETKDDLPRCGKLREVWATLVGQASQRVLNLSSLLVLEHF